jgi:hypothetical protein
MPTTYTLIASNTLSSAAASVTFSSIPATYTDLTIRFAYRDTYSVAANAAQARVTHNGTTANYSLTDLTGNGASASSGRLSNQANYETDAGAPTNANTANTFSNSEIYIPSYLVSQNKPVGVFSVGENNNATAYMTARAVLWRNTDAITSITLTANISTFVAGSSFFLYGIKNS